MKRYKLGEPPLIILMDFLAIIIIILLLQGSGKGLTFDIDDNAKSVAFPLISLKKVNNSFFINRNGRLIPYSLPKKSFILPCKNRVCKKDEYILINGKAYDEVASLILSACLKQPSICNLKIPLDIENGSVKAKEFWHLMKSNNKQKQ